MIRGTCRLRVGFTPGRAGFLAALSLLVLAAGCERDNMWTQAKVRTLGETEFFGDGRAAREPVAGTVAHGTFSSDRHFTEGLEGGKPSERFPVSVTARMLDMGEDRYMAHCSPCHGALGDGVSIVVQRGYKKPPPLADPRLMKATPGYLYRVLRSGVARKAAPSPDIIAGTGFDLVDVVHPVLGRKLTPDERWAVVAWMRVLQASQGFKLADLTPEERSKLPAAEGGGNGDR